MFNFSFLLLISIEEWHILTWIWESVRIQPQVHHSTLVRTHASLKDLIGVKTYTHTPPLAPHNIKLPLPPQTSQLSPAST